MIRVVAAAVAVLAAGVLAGCSKGPTTSVPPASVAVTLAPTPAVIPADFTSTAAIEAQLKGVALCRSTGRTSAICSLLSTTTNTAQIASVTPFEVRVFLSAADRDSYIALARGTNAQYVKDGSAPRRFLLGRSWVVSAQVDTSGLVETLRSYLGGTITS